MEDPQRLPNDVGDDEAAELQRQAEEAMEQMLLAQEDEDIDFQDGGINIDGANIENRIHDENVFVDGGDGADVDRQPDFAIEEDGNILNGNMGFLDDELIRNRANDHDVATPRKNPFTYVSLSLWAAVFLIYYSYRSRQQWYLALVFLSSSKYAYVIMGNAFVATLIWIFRVTTNFFLNGLRLNEAEGLTDYFRWHITETCLALTIFRLELNVKTFVLFLFLVLAKCLHYIVEQREAHLRMTEEIVVVNPSGKWFALRLQHVKLFALISFLQFSDVCAIILCGQDIMEHGPSVSILFAFESAIMLVSVISNCLLWYLHLLDGIFHAMHETSLPGALFHGWIYPWKDYKATLVFAVELQAQAAKFIFYLTFFASVMAYYGLPINLIREVYVSFLALKQRVMAFNKYRQLMASMNRFKSPTEEELEAEDRICIICRDEMTVETSKRLPGCGHIFHKSCLREWLVQQQTCPTCRGDISAMEARQKAQDQMNARIQEQRLQEETDEAEGEGIEEDKKSAAAQTNGTEQPTEASDGELQPGSLKVESDSDEKAPICKGAQETEAKAKSNTGLVDKERSAFPAFYRVVSNAGASVYLDQDADLALAVVRVVASGVVILGIEMEYRKCNEEYRMMIKIPDGWVSEDDVERIVAVPLEALPPPIQCDDFGNGIK